MPIPTLLSIASILVFGIGAQWLAWRLKQPSILFLLFAGFIAGPVLGILKPDALFGNLLSPIISLSVGIILFEGGLNLKLEELRHAFKPVRNLLTLGVVITWGLITGLAYGLLNMDIYLSALLGAILVVTGPTVIIPLLGHIRPIGNIKSILKWEGILIDPIGATLALLVFEMILVRHPDEAFWHAALAMIKTLSGAFVVGFVSAALLTMLLKKRLIPDTLQNAVTLTLVILTFATAEAMQEESGLLATTLMGLVLANQKYVSVKQIGKFSENLQILLISSLFILLAARLDPAFFTHLNVRVMVFIALLFVLVRPAAVWASTHRAGLSQPERILLCAIAPRGIVAAAVASITALRLSQMHYPHAEELLPVTFLVIIATIVVYGTLAKPLANRINVAHAAPKGILLVGAHHFARALGKTLQELQVEVVLVDTDKENVLQANSEGLKCLYISALSEFTVKRVEQDGILDLLALTSNDELNALATLHYAEILGNHHVFQLDPVYKIHSTTETISTELCGRVLFREGVTYDFLHERFIHSRQIRVIRVKTSDTLESLTESPTEEILPMFVLTGAEALTILAEGEPPVFKPGDRLILLAWKK